MSTSSSPSDASSAVIDERRAQQLMERAMGMSERGDTASAILACRQAIALAPNSSQSYSMLGLLLERSGDAAGAITAYEKVLELAPDSVLERESLGRLRATATQRRTTRESFVFNENELFDEERHEDLPTAPDQGVPAEEKTASADNISQAMLEAAATKTVADAFAAPAQNFSFTPVEESARVSSTEVQAAASDAIVEAAGALVPPAAKATVPKPAPSPAPAAPGTATAGASSLPFPSTLPRSAPSVFDSTSPLTLPKKEERLTLGQRLLRRPSFYFRSVPLGAAASVSLLFLLWAHTLAASRAANGVPSDIPGSAWVNDLPPDAVPGNPPASPTRPRVPAAGAVPTNPATTAPVAAAPVAPVAAANPGNPNVAAPSAPVAPAAPAVEQATPAVSAPGAPAPVAPAPAAPPASTSPTGGASNSGAPLGPTGSPDRSYVQVAPSGRSPVARPENNAANDERAASDAARAGRSDSAIDRMSRSIESGGSDVAFRYQQRAQMYLQSGDGNRAVADFQAAIAAYQDMINRGDRVSIARSGIQACRRGMQLAVARR